MADSLSFPKPLPLFTLYELLPSQTATKKIFPGNLNNRKNQKIHKKVTLQCSIIQIKNSEFIL